MNRGILMAAGLTVLFGLAACGDGSQNVQKTLSGRTVVELDESRFVDGTVPVTTQDGRDLDVTFKAYCEKLDHLRLEYYENDIRIEPYKNECVKYVKERLDLLSEITPCFEGKVPAVSSAVRNHEGLPQRGDEDHCYDAYPENYASWPEDVMRRALESTVEDNLFTVTKISPR